ncbi:hypothetical protein JQ604_34855 [Bradyrhizobium jicamae]|uniref:hypothetical protein n=1 Tax=Bradyrhizobium jicamae TaxID=280332 RepID=UPI001BAD03ED|nr:hypothetical protein [Bradyrhizobium jicamae]MBR0757390.1 hypothetical protein [Bradyrhizobium jicamae]
MASTTNYSSIVPDTLQRKKTMEQISLRRMSQLAARRATAFDFCDSPNPCASHKD